MTSFIDEQRARWGVEPICRTLQVAPSSYYATKVRPPSTRALRDAELGRQITTVHNAHFGVYGARKLWRQLRREDDAIGRDQVGRLMRALGLAGVTLTELHALDHEPQFQRHRLTGSTMQGASEPELPLSHGRSAGFALVSIPRPLATQGGADAPLP
jgi:transposase InsO family protein